MLYTFCALLEHVIHLFVHFCTHVQHMLSTFVSVPVLDGNSRDTKGRSGWTMLRSKWVPPYRTNRLHVSLPALLLSIWPRLPAPRSLSKHGDIHLAEKCVILMVKEFLLFSYFVILCVFHSSPLPACFWSLGPERLAEEIGSLVATSSLSCWNPFPAPQGNGR